MQRIYDNSAPALYLTRALLNPDTNVDSVLLSTDNLVPVRTNDNPATSGGIAKTDFAFTGTAFQFAPLGDLLGVAVSGPRNWAYSFVNGQGNTTTGNVSMGRHIGGGLLGSPGYMLLTIDENQTFVSDGAVEMPRKWARNLINDLMCRELPMIRPADADPYVVATSNIEFRKARDCTRCHATMDQMAATIRHVQMVTVSGQNTFTPRYGGVFIQYRPTNQTAETGWPAVSDRVYANRPPRGRLYYRDYTGALVNSVATDLPDLARQLAARDDVYICLASRYYEYFTGIKVNVGDVGDTSLGHQLTVADTTHRNIVINLGKRLKTHKKPRTLISEILNLPHYKHSDLGVSDTRGLAGE